MFVLIRANFDYDMEEKIEKATGYVIPIEDVALQRYDKMNFFTLASGDNIDEVKESIQESKVLSDLDVHLSLFLQWFSCYIMVFLLFLPVLFVSLLVRSFDKFFSKYF